MVKRWLVGLLLMAMVLPMAPTLWAKKNHHQAPVLDLVPLLAPLPAQDSPETKAEFAQLLEIQKTRTKEQVAYAQGDLDRNVFRFSDVMGDKFTAESLPLTAALFQKANGAASDAVKPVKELYNRPRPFTVDKDLKPCVKEEDTGLSYPSGHATAGTVMAVLLANMVPEKKAEIFARGWKFAYNRLVGGVHYPSDIQAGRIAGTLVAYKLLQGPGFQKQFKAAKAELRAALGYTDAKP